MNKSRFNREKISLNLLTAICRYTIIANFKLLFFYNGEGEEIRTLAPEKPTYWISNPPPLTTWVCLHILKINCPINKRHIHFSKNCKYSVSVLHYPLLCQFLVLHGVLNGEPNFRTTSRVWEVKMSNIEQHIYEESLWHYLAIPILNLMRPEESQLVDRWGRIHGAYVSGSN